MGYEPNPAERIFVSYIDKSREFYLAQDYGNPYKWAANSDAPFTPLRKPLAESRIGLVTTASPWPENPDVEHFQMPKVTFSLPTEPTPDRLYTENRSWDKEATHTNDVGSFLPVDAAKRAVVAGRIGSLSPRFYGAPTEYSQRRTNDVDAPQILEWCREDRVDCVLLPAL